MIAWVRKRCTERKAKALRSWMTHLALLKDDSEIDVNNLSSLLVNEDVVAVTIANSKDVADDTVDSD